MGNEKKYRKFDGFTTNAWRRPEAGPEPEPGDYVTTEELEQGLATKQNLLTAGSNITIENDVISINGDYLPLSGGTMTGDVSFQGVTNYTWKITSDGSMRFGTQSSASKSRIIGTGYAIQLIAGKGNYTHYIDMGHEYIVFMSQNETQGSQFLMSPTQFRMRGAPLEVVTPTADNHAATKGYVDGRVPLIQTQDSWSYKVYPDNTFEAWFGQTGLSYAITATSGGWYRSELMSLAAPQALYDAYDLDITFATVQVGHNNYPVICSSPTFYATGVNYYVLSGSSRTATPNYTLSCYMRGTLTPKS